MNPSGGVPATPLAAPVGWWDPYFGLAAGFQVLLVFLLALTLVTYVAVAVLSYQAILEPRRERRGGAGDEAQFLWVFVVPALDEEVTIADSVGRLAAVDVTHRVLLVVDDGSSDGTPGVLEGLDVTGLEVLRRDPPRARQGKAAALDDAWSHLHGVVLARPEHARWTPEQVVVCVVDADGRLAPGAPRVVARRFADPRVGGVQVLVRIYNRGNWLTWAQDVEFGVSACLYQLGRSRWGTANMGGNGQFTRLAALDAVATTHALPEGVERGPWRDRLTEDQDIGVRMLQAGWANAQTIDTVVEQQGLTNVRRLVRQRTRWAQGSWQTIGLVGGVRRIRAPLVARLDAAVYLFTPPLQVAMGAGLVLAVGLWAFDRVPFSTLWVPALVFFLGLTFFPALIALVLATRRTGPAWRPWGALLGLVPYLVYSWLVYPSVVIALVRHLARVRGWAKTAREPLDAHLPTGAPARPGD